MQEQIDAERLQLGQEGDQVLQAAAEPIDAPGHHNIELSASGGVMQRVEETAVSTNMVRLGGRAPRLANFF
jgi:3,4-dihydroxy-2-butanone 4-phosphate synthase